MKNKILQNIMRKKKENQTMRRKKALKLTAAVLCAALILGGTGVTMYALAADNETSQDTKGSVSDTDAGEKADTAESEKRTGDGNTGNSVKETGGMKTGIGTADGKLSKEETVYVLAGADGSTRKIIISDWLKNGTGADSLKDVSELVSIENVNGDEVFTAEADHVKIWDANGQDIYYQGYIEKELPIDISVTYGLDGKEISPEELAGKSGKVTIRFDYTNNQYEYMEVDNVRTKVYVPFAVITGMLLDNEIFTNVEVSGGRLINDGNRTAVIGFVLPGLKENLAVDSDKPDIPDYFEITADVREFELGMTASIATNEIFSGINIEDGDALEELNQALEELTDAMEQLEDGSSDLYDGLCTLLEKSGELISGINQLFDGASQLRNGIGTLDEGAAKLQNGAASLQAGLNTLSSKNSELNGGAKQIFDTLLATANSQLAAAGLEVPVMTVDNYTDVLNSVITSLDSDSVYQQAYRQVAAAVEAKRGEIETAVSAAVRESVASKVTAAVREQVISQITAGAEAEIISAVLQTTGMTKDEYDAALANGLIDEQTQAAVNNAVSSQMASDAMQKKISAAVEAQMAGADIQAVIEANVNQQMASEEVKGIISSNTETQIQKAIADNMAGETVQGQLAAASEGAKSVITLKTSLDSYNAFYRGLQAYTAGVAEAAGGAGELKNGTDELRSGTVQLYSGSSDLYDGIQTMKESSPALTDGITQLKDGAFRLFEGLCEFDEEGIQKLADAVNGDLDGLMERLKATLEVSKNYQSFSGLDDGMDGQVKFIYRMDSIEAEK